MTLPAAARNAGLRRELAFARARAGDTAAFTAWMKLTVTPLRRSLRRYARAVDVEVVIQETLLRMWQFATHDPPRSLEGENPSLRYCLGVARNVVREEARRLRHVDLMDDDELQSLPETWAEPAPASDPGLAAAIRRCRDRLPRKPRLALDARLKSGSSLPDRDIARTLSMKPNTFLQNIVRARKFLRACLERAGVRLEEIPA